MAVYNWPIIGHEKISKFLQKSLDKGRLSHAYLFSGQEHLGKTLMTENFVASILCSDYHNTNNQKVNALPCNECIFCTQLAKGIHPDVYYLKKEEGKKNISVEQVREMKKFLNLTSFLNSYKIALIENAEELSESAQNALLKILEEPSPKTILILLAPDFNLLLPTIVSRCQLLRFYPLSEEEIYHYLINLGAKREEARILTAISHGQIGMAINYFKNPDLFFAQLEKIKNLLSIFDRKLIERFKILEDLLRGQSNLESSSYLNEELDYWQLLLRDILIIQNNLEELVVNLHFKEDLKRLANKYSQQNLLNCLAYINKIKYYSNFNINPRLAAENLILNF